MVDEVVESVAVSLNSELAVLEALSSAAQQYGKVHDIVLMVDLGDLREGIWPDDLIPIVRQANELPGIHIKGLGTNLACFAGVMPDADNMNRLVELATEVEQCLNVPLELVSGINSSGLDLIASGGMPERVNHARIGEAILLGRETTHRKPWPDTYQDAFVLHAEVLELKKKPSIPLGDRSEDAFGTRPEIEQRGEIVRALLNVGREDIHVEGLAPQDPRVVILGASSGYLVVDVTAAAGSVRVGDTLSFLLNYAALLAAMTSGYVKKHAYRGGVLVEA
jgi:predicted amino acid racemase